LNGDNLAEDNNGHGTHVAGIVGAQGRRITGTAPRARLLVIKIAETEESWDIVDVVAGIQHAIDSQVDIISISGEFSELDSNLEKLRNKIAEATAKGIVTIASAGNNFNDFPVDSFPASFDDCISVGSIKQDGSRADSSSHSTKLDVVSPGENILSSWMGTDYRVESGTSMATPFVSGIVAVIKSFAKAKLNRTLTPSEIQIMLNKTADDVGNQGFDTSYGFGIINPIQALKMLIK
jgi:subtilisin family serine protease